MNSCLDDHYWDFVEHILERKGFLAKMIEWIMLTVRGGRVCIILNGENGPYFKTHPGLRQGDPLSPMLFILVMDVLNSLFLKAEAEGLLSPLLSTGQRLSLYADDVALFIRPTEEDLQLTKDILRCFGEASRLQTNL